MIALAQAAKSAAEAEWHVYGDLWLADPLWLGAAPLVWLALLYGRGRAGRARGRAPLATGFHPPRTWRQRLAFVAPTCAFCAALLVAVALARPVRANALETTVSEGVDIALVLDRSGSMRYPDMEDGKTRLDVVKEVVGDFAERRTQDEVGAADSVALISFARFPELLCPFTLDVGALHGFLDGIEIAAEGGPENATAIGRALAKAVALLRRTDAKSKVCVLLTDGENNVEDIQPIAAAELAAEEGIRVYTILAGRYQYRLDPFTGRAVPTRAELDTTELRRIAELTGGRFYRARDRESLEDVYARIEELEKTERVIEENVETFDLYPRVLWPALLCYLAAWLSWSTWARRIA